MNRGKYSLFSLAAVPTRSPVAVAGMSPATCIRASASPSPSGFPGAQTSAGDANGDVLSGIENLYGSKHADTLTGDGSDNRIDGMGGADTINGVGGNDRISISSTPTKVDGDGGNTDVLIIKAGGSPTLTDDNFADFDRVTAYDGATLDMSGVSTSGAAPSGLLLLSYRLCR